MASTGIFELLPITGGTGALSAADVFAVVDVSDTTQAPQGSLVKITLAQLYRTETTAVTVSTPLPDVAQTWNAGGVTFTAVKINVTDTASAAASLLTDFQVGGSSKWKVTKAGAVTQASTLTVTAGGAAITGDSAITGNATVTGNVTVTGTQAFSGVGTWITAAEAPLDLMSTTGNTGLRMRSSAVGSLTDETYHAFYLRDLGNVEHKGMSLSARWADASASAGYVAVRFNASYLVAGVQVDDQSIIQWGGRGVGIFAPSSLAANAPGNKVLKVWGRVDLSGTGGGQIAFPATQNASSDANTLDDYEENTWSPVLTGSTSGTGVTNTVFAAEYTKIGRQVTVMCHIRLTNAGSGTGDMVITGLPYTPYNNSNWEYVGTVAYDTLNMSVGSIGVVPFAVGGSTSITFMELYDNAASTRVAFSALSSSASFVKVTLTYFTAT